MSNTNLPDTYKNDLSLADRVLLLERLVKEILTGHEDNKRDDLLKRIQHLEAQLELKANKPGVVESVV